MSVYDIISKFEGSFNLKKCKHCYRNDKFETRRSGIKKFPPSKLTG